MVLNRQRKIRIPLEPLEDFLSKVRKELKLGNAELVVALVSNSEIAKMNLRFRRKQNPTDVLSFPATNSPKGKRSSLRTSKHAEYLGDVAIAPETARRYARKYGRPLNQELRVLILHGVLHLLGYDHERDRGQMHRIEQRLRRRLGLL
jgi:probable rRNA maturation factor